MTIKIQSLTCARDPIYISPDVMERRRVEINPNFSKRGEGLCRNGDADFGQLSIIKVSGVSLGKYSIPLVSLAMSRIIL